MAKLATLIQAARADAIANDATCVLFDNGDTFQGTPLGDMIAESSEKTEHPMVRALNWLGYDAGGIGNHDFDFGVEQLASCLEGHKMPVVCSNLKSKSLPMLRESIIIERDVKTATGQLDKLRIGILSSLPDKTAMWSRRHVNERVEFSPALPALKSEARMLREKGADLVVVLAHMGIALFDEGDDAQNQIVQVSELEDVDVVIGGHTHLRFPGPAHENIPEADCKLGMVNGKPVVQPGSSASDLGVIDLTIGRSSKTSGWKVLEAMVELRSTSADTQEEPQIVEIARSMHQKTCDHLSEPVAKLSRSMNSYFALAHPSPVPALLAAAKHTAVARAAAGTDLADLPIIAVASTPSTGGFDGPENFLDLPAGQLNRQHVAGMNPYTNHVWAVKTNGAQLVDWLERSALIFNTLNGKDPDQLLIDSAIPGFRFDAIYGLTYEIDPRKPPRFDTSGKINSANSGRISNVCWQGQPVKPDQVFLVATTDHRAGGGGLYKSFADNEIVLQGHAPLQDAVLNYLKEPDYAAICAAKPWSFVKDLQCSAVLLTAPEAADHLEEIAPLRPEPCGETSDGFLKLRVHL